MAEPVKAAKRDAPRWWVPKTDDVDAAIEKAMEKEVYRAVREFLTSNDPDTTLDWLAVPGDESAPRDVAVRVVIEGRGDFPEIRRDFVLARMVEEEIKERTGSDGINDAEDAAYLVALAESFERLAQRIRTALATGGSG